MGNYLRLDDFTPGNSLPRIFEPVFLCAPDVDDDIFEPGKALSRLPELCRCVTVYYNRQDKAMVVSDYVRGNPERLGSNSAARSGQLHHKVNQADCTAVVPEEGFVEHGYYQVGYVNGDVRLSMDGAAFDDVRRKRVKSAQGGTSGHCAVSAWSG